VVDHRAQKLPDDICAIRVDLSQRAVDAVGLQAGELADQRLALCGGEKKALPAVVIAGLLHDIAFVEQLLEHAPERLLGDSQDVQEVGDLQTRIAADEMQHPVMRPPEPESLELVVGVADEIPVGEEQELDDIPAQIGNLLTRGSPVSQPRISVGRGNLLTQAITLVLHHPTAAAAVNDPEALNSVDRPGVAVLKELLAQAAAASRPSTAMLLERWRDLPEYDRLAELAMAEPLVAAPEAAAKELQMAIQKLLEEYGPGHRMDELLRKAEEMGLNYDEKAELSQLLKSKGRS